MDWKLGALAIIAVLIIFLVPYNVISEEDVIGAAEESPEAQLFMSMYPDATMTVHERGCVEKWFNEFVRDDTTPLAGRTDNVVCFEDEKDWVVTYRSAAIVDTPGLRIGVSSKTKEIIDAAFTSPYDDVHVVNYTIITTRPVIEVIMNKSGIVSREGWAAFEKDGIKYLTFTIPYPDKLTVLFYIEKTPEYKVPSTENFRTEIDEAHEKFDAGAKEFSSMLRSGFVEDFNVTSSYLFFPTPAE